MSTIQKSFPDRKSAEEPDFRSVPATQERNGRRALFFLLPAVLLLVVYVAYPLIFSLGRSLFDSSGDRFVGLGNYVDALTDDRTLGLLFAVLTERIKWATVFRLVLFMPMAISLFASGVIFRLVYDENPDLGVANAASVTVHDIFTQSSPYPGARPREVKAMRTDDAGIHTVAPASPGSVVEIPLVGVTPQSLPSQARPVNPPSAKPGELRGLVWLDISGASNREGTPDAAERGMPGLTVQAIRAGRVVATTTTGDDGQFIIPGLPAGDYSLQLPADGFAEPFSGLTWLGPGLVTPVIMSAWIWIMTGFAMTFIAAGLSAIPRDALEAARVDGATEWQVFRRVTVPLLGPVLLVVFITLVINVLKIFELVYVVAPGSVQAQANVLALEMWQVSFGAGGDQGVGSALGILLFLLVVPAMIFNVRRFRRDRSR
jgi:alpha-glucoside transport system permease protein